MIIYPKGKLSIWSLWKTFPKITQRELSEQIREVKFSNRPNRIISASITNTKGDLPAMTSRHIATSSPDTGTEVESNEREMLDVLWLVDYKILA